MIDYTCHAARQHMRGTDCTCIVLTRAELEALLRRAAIIGHGHADRPRHPLGWLFGVNEDIAQLLEEVTGG